MEKRPEWSDAMNKAFGRRIAAAREAKGWSLAALADRLQVSRATIGHWETGARTIKHDDLAKLCEALGVSVDEMLFGIQRWPFPTIDFRSVIDLDSDDLRRLEGALLLVSAQLGLELKQLAAA